MIAYTIQIMLIIFQLLLILFFLVTIIILVYSMLFGGPYAPIGEQKIEQMLSLLKTKPKEIAADIGSGDGRIVIALAKKGVIAHGYELNPLLVLIARYKIRKAGLSKKAFIHMTDMWRVNYNQYDIITVYLAPHVMKRLEKKLKPELKKSGRIAMNHYHFPNWKFKKRINNIYLYSK